MVMLRTWPKAVLTGQALAVLCCCASHQAVVAQAAPGGVSNPVLWLRADDAGTIATAWKDNSPQARNVEAVGSWSVSAADRAHNFNP